MTEVGPSMFMPIEAADMVGSGSCGVPCPFREVRIADGTVGRTAVIVENVVMESVATRDGNLRRQIGVLPRAERAVWSGRAKLSLRHASPPGVYDLAMDPEERQNLWRGRLPDDAAVALATGLLGELARAAAITEDAEGAALGAAFGRLMDGAAAGSDDR